ncbi:MAG: CocE/NonD family hydrolase [Bryobacteraceae bacterium]
MKLKLMMTVAALIAASTSFAASSNYSLQSVYVPMKDGVWIAVDIALPAVRANGQRLPAILVQTRYWRGMQLAPGVPDPEQYDTMREFKSYFTANGYAVVVADVRGTGASFGEHPNPWSKKEVGDGYELVEWMTRQPWCNGRVAGVGVSYDGTTAQNLAISGHPAVKAIIPQAMEWDVYSAIAFPGGVRNDWFLRTWSAANQVLDRNRLCDDESEECAALSKVVLGVRRVDEDRDGSLLARALEDHRRNRDLYEAVSEVEFRDQAGSKHGLVIDEFSVHTYAQAIQRSRIPMFGWGSWHDGATAQSVIRRFQPVSNPQIGVIGNWNHGSTLDSDPYHAADAPLSMSVAEQFELQRQFLDAYMKDGAPKIETGWLRYYTLGEDRWKQTGVWPPRGFQTERWYLDAGKSLGTSEPSSSGIDYHQVDFDASTGMTNRWVTQAGGGDVIYGDRAEADERLLAYTSDPLGFAREVTGSPIVKLQLASTHADGAVFVYLEDVAPDGTVPYLTEGMLRLIHRQPASGGELHTFRKDVALPMAQGVMAEVSIEMQPVSVLIPAGHRIRVAIAGHDASVFARYPESGVPTLTIGRDRAKPSFIELPMVRR